VRWRASFIAFALVLATLARVDIALAQGETTAPDPLERVSASPVPAQLAGPIDASQYRVGPGDEFTLFLTGRLTRQVPLPVGLEGEVYSPDLGAIPVADSTLRDAREAILRRVRERFREVVARVQLTRVRTFRVFLTGEIRVGGPVPATAVSRVIDVLPDSLLLADASHRNIEIHRRDGTRRIVDLERFRTLGDAAADDWLRDGDVIHVPPALEFAGVWGAVAHSGEREVAAGEDLRGLLEMAGGTRPNANPDSVLYVRFVAPAERESTWVSLARIRSGGFDPEVHDGDQLYVFATATFHEVEQVTVVGRVAHAGTFPVRSGVTHLREVLAAAGGLLPDADASSVTLVRATGGTHADPEFDRLSRLSREEMTGSEYATFLTRLAALSPEFRIDLTRSTGSGVSDPVLLTNDVIRVEKQSRTIRVDGQVRHPGLVEFRPGADWRSYVEHAGGMNKHAARTQVRITRSASGQTLLARDVDYLAPGDFIWVPERPDFSFWPLVKDVLVVGAQLATITVAVRR
jgi:protein involved in polysaccharide export with SLBB domain